jgi:hypothetical protein
MGGSEANKRNPLNLLQKKRKPITDETKGFINLAL